MMRERYLRVETAGTIAALGLAMTEAGAPLESAIISPGSFVRWKSRETPEETADRETREAAAQVRREAWERGELVRLIAKYGTAY